MTQRGTPATDPGRLALVAWLVIAALVAIVVRIHVQIRFIGDLGSALVAVVFLYAPVVIASRRGEDLADYGFHVEPVRRSLGFALVTMAIVFPLFALGFYGFHAVACASHALTPLVPANLCSHWSGFAGIHAPRAIWNQDFGEFCLVQLVVVALPEELCFRGCLLRLLEQRFPPKHRVLGGGIGWALVISAAMFAIVHLPRDGNPAALMVFFPGLLFGWLRSATGSIFASTVTHAGSNILIRVLNASVLR